MNSSSLPFIPRYRLTPSAQAWVIAANLAALIFLHFDLFTQYTTHLIGGFSGDGGLYYWLFRHNSTRLFHESWFNTNAFFPYAQTLAWSDNFIFPSAIGWLFTTLGLGEITSYNLLLTTAMLLMGVTTSVLAFHLCGDLLCALFAGVLFMNASYFSSVIGHPQLLFAFYLPLALDMLFKFLAERSITSLLALGLCVTLAFLTTVYYALFTIVLCAFVLAALLLLRPHAFSLFDCVRLIIFTAAGCLPLLLFLPPYFEVQATFGERHLYEPYFFSASALSLISSSYSSLLYPFSGNWGDEESHLFAGLLPLVLLVPITLRLTQTALLKKIGAITTISFFLLAIASAFGRERLAEWAAMLFSYTTLAATFWFLWVLGKTERALGAHHLTPRSLIAIFLSSFIFFFCVSLGPLGNPAEGNWALGVHRILFALVPGFDSLRAISRIGVISLLALALLSAFSIQLLRRQTIAPRRWIIIAFAFLLIENASYPHVKEPLPTPPTALKLLAERAQKNEAMIVLPYSGALNENGEIGSWKQFAKINVTAMNWALDAGVPTVNGYSGQQTKFMKELPRDLRDFPSDRALRALREIAGLKFILYSTPFVENFKRGEFEQRLRAFSDRLLLKEVDSEGNYLFELQGEQHIDKDFYLIVPSFPPHTLNIQLKALNDAGVKDAKEKTLSVMIHSLYEKSPYFNLHPKSDGEYKWYRLALPPGSDYVRPLRLYFKSSNLESFVLGDVRLLNQNNE